MKNFKFIYLFVLFTFTEAYSQDMSKVNIRKFVFQMMQVYSPNHAEMITTYEKAPAQVTLPNATLNVGKTLDYMSYVKDSSRKELIIHSMGQMIREMAYAFSHRVAYNILMDKKIIYELGVDYRCVFINANKVILIKQMKAFPAKAMVEDIPAEFRTDYFKDYIQTDNSEVLSQKMGIYGLLQIWNGYYQATQLCFNLKNYYQKEGIQDIKTWEHFLADYYENYAAYAAFKYYILKYLEKADSEDPFLFNYVTGDKNFREAYKEIDNNFQKVIGEFEKLKPQIFDYVKKQGMNPREVVVDNRSLTYLDNVGIENHKNIYTLYNKALQDNKLKNLEAKLKEAL